MRYIFCLGLVLIYYLPSNAQRYTIHGTVSDLSSGELLLSATVYDLNSLEGTNSNVYGFYSLSLKPATVRIRVTCLGYLDEILSFELTKDTTLNVKLAQGLELKEVEVTASRIERIDQTTRMSTIDVPIDQIKKLPALFGEVDILKSLQLLPGVSGGSEGTAGLYVRGGSPDQNLILLDGVPVYNVYHLGGIFSVFNADALKNVSLTKGGFPARFGGRLSSVLEIGMKEGNDNKFHGEGGLGILSSRLTLEGPIKKNKASFMISGRRTYVDVIAKPLIKRAAEQGEEIDLGMHFYDLNAKVNYTINSKHRLFGSVYSGEDLFSLGIKDVGHGNDYSKSKAGVDWGNFTSALRWNYILSPKWFANTTLTYSRYRFNFRAALEEKTNNQIESFSALYFSGIEDLGAKFDMDYVYSPNHWFKFGGQIINHKYSPGATQFKSDISSNIDTTFGSPNISSVESALYFEDDIRMGAFGINAGIHASSFSVQHKLFTSLQPRFSARYLLGGGYTAKLSFATMTQYINLLTNEGSGLPSDLWVPSTKRIVPQNSSQLAAGLVKIFGNDYECSVEAYYKKMNNVLSYKEGASFIGISTNWEDKVLQGKGEAYGFEFFVQKKKGKFNGWIGYTLSWNDRNFDDINGGKTFRFKYDRRHDFELVASYQISKKWHVSGSWQYATGNAITLPILKYNGIYPFDQYIDEIHIQGEKNAYTMPPYHRLDLSFEYKRFHKRYESGLVFGVYNAYARANPFYITTDREYIDGQYRDVFKQVALLPLIPNISYQFKF